MDGPTSSNAARKRPAPTPAVAMANKVKRRSLKLATRPTPSIPQSASKLPTPVRNRNPIVRRDLNRTALSTAPSNRAGPGQPRTATRPAPTRSRTVSTPAAGANTTTRSRPPSPFEKRRAEAEAVKKAEEDRKKRMADLEKENVDLRDSVARKNSTIDALQKSLSESSERQEGLNRELAELKGLYQLEQKTHEECRRFLAQSKEECLQLDMTSRKLLNDVIDLKGQIRVAVRIRPQLGEENKTEISHISYPTPNTVAFQQAGKESTFNFDNVFHPKINQARVFEDVKELILSCLHGYNVAIVAYGQTGSGKTHTMRGGEDDQMGIIPRAIDCVFRNRDRLTDVGWKFDLSVSYLEVYNEEVFDLLGKRVKLAVKMGSGSAIVEGLTVRPVRQPDDIWGVLQQADNTRSVAATKMNANSSRSHAVFRLMVKATNEALGQSTVSTLNLVDLAGSERAKDSGSDGNPERFREMTAINNSLSQLQQCIRGQLGKNQHIPFRNSKLTMLLSDSLGAGNSKTMVIVGLNPMPSQMNESKRSLDFAKQMGSTKIGTATKQEK